MAEPRTVRENANTLSSVQIAEILPHRYPFALVDRILDYEPGQWAIGRKCVTRNEEFFNGHFPAQPVMPGVLLLEALAQTGAVAALSLPENKGKLALFGGIKSARFRKQVTPGDVLTLHCEEDLSLTEIAQEVGISRQGVHELLTRAARKMFEMEEKLHVAARFQRVENGLEKCRTMMREGRYDDAERMIDALIRFDQEENNGL